MATPHSKTAQGKVDEAIPNSMFIVELDGGKKLTAHIGADLKMRSVRLLPGDRVTVEILPYDPSRCRITERHQ
jgi:translation initiation factor IF-1